MAYIHILKVISSQFCVVLWKYLPILCSSSPALPLFPSHDLFLCYCPASFTLHLFFPLPNFVTFPLSLEFCCCCCCCYCYCCCYRAFIIYLCLRYFLSSRSFTLRCAVSIPFRSQRYQWILLLLLLFLLLLLLGYCRLCVRVSFRNSYSHCLHFYLSAFINKFKHTHTLSSLSLYVCVCICVCVWLLCA